MSGSERRAGQGGFTLVEMLVSVALLSLVLGVFGGLLFRLHRTGAAVAGLETAEEVGAVRRFIATSLAGSRTLLHPADAGRRFVHFSGEAHRVTFATVANGAREVGGLYETTLWRDAVGNLTMLRRPIGWAGGEPLPPKVLLRGVATLSFSYAPCPAYPAAPEATRWIGQDHLPQRITVCLTFEQGDARAWPDLQVFPEAAVCRFLE